MCSKGVVLVSYRSVHTRWDQSDRCVIQRTHEREMSAMAKPPLQSKGKKRSSLQVKLQVDKVQCSCPEQFCWSLTASYAVKGLFSSSTGVKEIKILINISIFFILRTLKQTHFKAFYVGTLKKFRFLLALIKKVKEQNSTYLSYSNSRESRRGNCSPFWRVAFICSDSE